jgi:hypothetical protein
VEYRLKARGASGQTPSFLMAEKSKSSFTNGGAWTPLGNSLGSLSKRRERRREVEKHNLR